MLWGKHWHMLSLAKAAHVTFILQNTHRRKLMKYQLFSQGYNKVIIIGES